MAAVFHRAIHVMTRTKIIREDELPTKLKRVLTLLDLVMLGIGSTLGLGAYVLSGSIAKLQAGPAVCISFLIAAISSFFSGLCYAEFAARVPKAGSAYVYSYVTVGELAAFVIGWNLVLEYVIGGASVARGLSNYIDNMMEKRMQKALTEALPLPGGYMGKYPDFLASGFLILGTLLLAWGVQESSFLNKVCTIVNLITITGSVAIGLFYADIDNWNKPRRAVPAPEVINNELHSFGTGGFMPYGTAGVMAGAATAFYGFVGFDCLATTGEEAKRPKRDIPLAIIISLSVILIAYFSMSVMVTLAIPYYEQDHEAPLAHLFKKLGLYEVRWFIAVGAVCGLTTNVIGCLYPLPRVLYSMANDRLIFMSLSYINDRTHTPILAIFLGGGLAATLSCLLDIKQLIDMMSIGTLLAYSIVSLCVLIIRYGIEIETVEEETLHDPSVLETDERQGSRRSTLEKLWNIPVATKPNKLTKTISYWSLAVYVVAALILSLTLATCERKLQQGCLYAYIVVLVALVLIVLSVATLARQPMSKPPVTFKVPLMPFLPLASIITNMSLMSMLDYHTWIRLFIWLLVGMLIYVLYGITHSKEGSVFKLKTQEAEDPTESPGTAAQQS